MRYEAAFDAPADGRYELDLGAVSDLAEVAIDDGAPTVLPWPPYRLALGRLARGRHKLTVTVACGPGNRERLANLAVGWLGPVTLIGA